MEFRSQIEQIFGTTDPDRLREIARRARCYDSTVHNARGAGRKAKLSGEEIGRLFFLHHTGVTTQALAAQFGVSRQTVSAYLRRVEQTELLPSAVLRYYFLGPETLCTVIDIDLVHERIAIQNYTDEIVLRAFGVNENPTWADFEWFLRDRSIPPTRAALKPLLRQMGIPFYDPMLMIEHTQGRMAEDGQWIEVERRAAGLSSGA